MSSNVISSTLDSTACLVSSSFSPLMRDIRTHFSTSDTLSRHEHVTVRSHTAASPRRRAANCRTGSSLSCLAVISAKVLTWLLCLTTASVSISLSRSATLMFSTLSPSALSTAFLRATSGQWSNWSLSRTSSTTLEALTYWFHVRLKYLKSS